MEQKLKTMLGEQMFALAAMQAQLEALTKELEALTAERAADMLDKEEG